MENQDRQIPPGSQAWFASGAVFGLLAVAAAAFAAHLPDRMLAPGGREHLRACVEIIGWHAAALLAAAIWLGSSGLRRLVHLAALCFVLGTACFCIGVAVPALGGPHLGKLAPTGGALLMIGWGVACRIRDPRWPPVSEIRSAYLANEATQPVLAEELARLGVTIAGWHGALGLSPDPPHPSVWALDIWTAPATVSFASIGEAAKILRDRQRNWSLVPVVNHRRCALIEARLPPVKAAALAFPAPAPQAPLGAWTLLAPDRMLLSTTKSSPFVGGVCRLVEDREGPPSRAYLKLWEACTRLGQYPEAGQRCMDLGAAPGGWSWALAQLGADVVAVDKADLAPSVAAMPNVTLRRESAFGIEANNEPALDWLFSDIIAYPARLLGLVRRWIEAGKAARILCTIKFQGTTDHETAEQFATIPGARLLHLSHNKHELTFFWQRSCVPPPA